MNRHNQWGIPRIRAPRRRPPYFDLVVLCVVVGLLLVALLGPLFAPDVNESHILEALQPPSGAHWFGTDQQGRDVFWRLVAGARVTMPAAILVVCVYGTIGSLVAAVAAFGPRWLDEALMRLTDVVLAFPSLVFALAVAAGLGPSLRSTIIALAVTGWPLTARLLRGTIRETTALPFVEGATALGVSRLRLMRVHVLPNSLPPLLIKWAADVGTTILAIGGLSFIGAGAQPPSPEWGAMVSSAQGLVSSAWWAAFFPGLAIALTTTAFGLFGDLLHARSDSTVTVRTRARRP
ncbi:ABC transporter permease [Kribbella sp. WER1]